MPPRQEDDSPTDSTPHKYDLRPRKLIKRVQSQKIPKPRFGDRVSVFWDFLETEYEGTVKEFDSEHKTFLVEYDEIPIGHDSNRIWEGLNLYPWRLLSRLHDFGQSSVANQGSTRNLNLPNAENESDSGPQYNPRYWIQPGELGKAFPEFRSDQQNDIDESDQRGNNNSHLGEQGNYEPPDDEEEHDIESVGRNEETNDNFALRERSNRTEEPEESNMILRNEIIANVSDIPPENLSTKETGIGHSMRRQGASSATPIVRRYPSFGVGGFTGNPYSVPQGPRQFQDIDFFSSLPSQTVKINFMGGSSSNQEAGVSYRTHRSAFVPVELTNDNEALDEQGANSPSDEDRIRTITRTLGIHGPSSQKTKRQGR